MEDKRIVYQTMELADCKDRWTYNEEYECWCLEDVVYTPNPLVPHCQRINIFVPKAYMKEHGEIDLKGRVNGYHASEAPIIFENNSAGYMEMTNVALGEERCYAKPYLELGYVYVSCGNRGSMSVDQEGNFCGKSPMNLVDIKTAVRFLRHNRKVLPGNMDRIISVGWSAGGAMSTLLAVTGDNENFDAYLEENGAFMDESDGVFAAQIYCPIIDLEHADFAYEWMFGKDEVSEWTGELTPFEKALSRKLSDRYITYFNSLNLKDPKDGSLLYIGRDGRSGTGYEYLMKKLGESAEIFLKKLEKGEITRGGSAKEYADRFSWLIWDGEKAEISDLDTYVLNHRRRMKSCPSFDVLSGDSCENKVFGSKERSMMHFNEEMVEILEELKEDFPEECENYLSSYIEARGDSDLKKRIDLINPFNYIGTKEKSWQAEHYRIRVGASDPDTSLSVSMTLACKLAEAGKPVDYQLVWEQPHCEADYPGEIIAWIEEIVRG